MTAGTAVALRTFGTGLLRTTVTAGPDGTFVWRREPGPHAPAPFVPAHAGLAGAVAAIGRSGAARWVPGTADGGARTYRVRGDRAVAGHILRDGPAADLVPALTGLGRALRALHGAEPPPDAPLGRTPRAVTRMRAWLDGRAASPRAAHAESLLRGRLGADRLDAVRALTDRLTGGSDAVLSHGAPGLGSLIPAATTAADRDGVDALIGEDVCRAPWYFDLGFALGELVELRWYLGGDAGAWSALLDALLAGYGRDPGDSWRELAAFRVLLHVHDYTAYVGWDTTVFDRYTGFAAYLLTR
jgi:hypothetical protein